MRKMSTSEMYPTKLTNGQASQVEGDLSGRLIIKVELYDDIRRFAIHNEEITYDELLLMMQRVFRGKLRLDQDILIKYKDEDGDLITIFDSADLAFAVQSESRVLRLKIFVRNEVPLTRSTVPKYRSLGHELKLIRERVSHMLFTIGDRSPATLAYMEAEYSNNADTNVEDVPAVDIPTGTNIPVGLTSVGMTQAQTLTTSTVPGLQTTPLPISNSYSSASIFLPGIAGSHRTYVGQPNPYVYDAQQPQPQSSVAQASNYTNYGNFPMQLPLSGYMLRTPTASRGNGTQDQGLYSTTATVHPSTGTQQYTPMTIVRSEANSFSGRVLNYRPNSPVVAGATFSNSGPPNVYIPPQSHAQPSNTPIYQIGTNPQTNIPNYQVQAAPYLAQSQPANPPSVQLNVEQSKNE